MLATIVFAAFVGGFCLIVLIGHVLLVLAVWPDLAPGRRVPDNVAETAPGEPAPSSGPAVQQTKLAA